MDRNTTDNKPEVYALHQDGANWQISRRDFLRTAGIGAAALGVSLNSRLVRPAYAEEDLEDLCKEAPAHKKNISSLCSSPDGKFLVSADTDGTLKCWDFESFALLGTKSLNQKAPHVTAGLVSGQPCVIYTKGITNDVYFRQLPEMTSEKEIETGFFGGDLIRKMSSDERGSVDFLTLDQSNAGKKSYKVSRIETDGSQSHVKTWKTLYKTTEEIASFAVFDNGRKALAVMRDRSFRIISAEDGTVKQLDIPDIDVFDGFSVCPGEFAFLYTDLSEKHCLRLVSLADGSVIRAEKLNGSKYSDSGIKASAVTPDGSLGILLGESEGKQVVFLISMADGSLLKEAEAGAASEDCLQIAAAGDGTKFAVANGQSILFFSLPDLTLIGCPVDLEEMNDKSKGIKVTSTDKVTGRTVTYTLPCGAAIPAGAVCTCNCVAGSVPSCSCVGHTCSCHSHRPGSGGGGGHYWHPN